jgi:hypothetical protein
MFVVDEIKAGANWGSALLVGPNQLASRAITKKAKADASG